ncbi:MAG: GTPase HflX, partial [Bacteroidia bacterium]|nr:GTPase HflX [Bacteroidia bacterium]
NKVLEEIDSAKKPSLLVFNKIDQYVPEQIEEDDLVTIHTSRHFSIEEWKKTWFQRLGDNVIFISALKKENLEEFRTVLYKMVREIHITRFPYNNFLYPEIPQ